MVVWGWILNQVQNDSGERFLHSFHLVGITRGWNNLYRFTPSGTSGPLRSGMTRVWYLAMMKDGGWILNQVQNDSGVRSTPSGTIGPYGRDDSIGWSE